VDQRGQFGARQHDRLRGERDERGRWLQLTAVRPAPAVTLNSFGVYPS
jgi:hypothetical protein